MEQTLGNRIMANRKRLGLTQDALAEKLGVTAQAVSKWENDQSCPDITTLPKLSDIFGISTDALLGHETQPVHEAEVIEDTDASSHHANGTWEFRWEGGKKGSIFFALFVILTGALMLLARSFDLDTSLWSLAWPSFLLCLGLYELSKKFSFAGIISTLVGGYFIVNNLGIWELHFSSKLIFPGILVLFGISLLVDALKKPKKPKFHISRNGVKLCDEKGNHKTTSTCNCEDNCFTCNHAFGENSQSITLPQLQDGEINCSFGELTVDLSGCETVSDHCQIEANCSFGELELLVPKKFRVEPVCSTSFASVNTQGQPDPTPLGIIQLEANVSFGEIVIKYIE